MALIFRATIRITVCVGVAFVMTACATSPDKVSATDAAKRVKVTPAQTDGTGLSAQTLAPGECGLFGWDTVDPPTFVFFATSDRALYKSSDDEAERLTPVGTFPSLDYGRLKLTLGTAEPLVAGTRYAQARVSQVLDDGFTRVRPLVVLQSCQPVATQ